MGAVFSGEKIGKLMEMITGSQVLSSGWLAPGWLLYILYIYKEDTLYFGLSPFPVIVANEGL